MKKRIVSLLLALVMVLSLVPTTVWAAEDHDGQVRVIVENTTYAKADGAAWDGTLVDKWVDLVPGSSMMDCIVSALGSYSQTGADSGYITEINGLTAGDGGAASGWMNPERLVHQRWVQGHQGRGQAVRRGCHPGHVHR